MSVNKLRLSLSFVARLVSAAIWLYAGIVKAKNSIDTEQSILGYRIISGELVTWFAILIPTLEIILGTALLFGIFTRISALFSALLMIFFICILISAWIRHLEVSCGCFGNAIYAGNRNSFLWDIFRDIGFLAISVWLVIFPKSWFSLSQVVR